MRHPKDAVAAERTQRREATEAELDALRMEIDGPEAVLYEDEEWGQDEENYGADGFVEEGALEGDLDVEEE